MARKRRLNAAPKRAQKRTQKRQPTREPVAAAAPANPFEPMERLMQAFMPMSMAWLRPWLVEPHTPKLDVIDRNGALIVRAKVPGIDKDDVDSARAKATFKDGVLEVMLPKASTARARIR